MIPIELSSSIDYFFGLDMSQKFVFGIFGSLISFIIVEIIVKSYRRITELIFSLKHYTFSGHWVAVFEPKNQIGGQVIELFHIVQRFNSVQVWIEQYNKSPEKKITYHAKGILRGSYLSMYYACTDKFHAQTGAVILTLEYEGKHKSTVLKGFYAELDSGVTTRTSNLTLKRVKLPLTYKLRFTRRLILRKYSKANNILC